jgi:hypothetical protein
MTCATASKAATSLRVGSLRRGGWTLTDQLRAADSPPGESCVRNKAVVLLSLAGGPSQFETLDPPPHGPERCTSINGHIPTALPEVRFSAYLPRLARMADRLHIARSFQTHYAKRNGAHEQILTGDLTIGDGQPIREPGIGARIHDRA